MGALAEHATKAKYLNIVLNSSRVEVSIEVGLILFIAISSLMSTCVDPAKGDLCKTKISLDPVDPNSLL